MRNLKKILALVLALVMSLSLMATAGAGSFQDVTDDNPYKTAIDVLDQLKVFQGFEDGTFKPTDTLTRAQAAVLVYRIATGDVENKYLDNYTYMQQSKFTDLDGYNWAKGYINYCQNAGIVVGTDATHFNPGGQVTGYQLLVMLLRTLGYGKAGEFTDPKGWELQTASIAEREGILKNVTGGDFEHAAPRQMVAEILFRGILHDTVEYSPLTPGGYTNSGVSLGKKTLNLDDIEGVVVANRIADLYDTEPMKDGQTRMIVDGKDYVIDMDTDATAIGLNHHAYVQNGKVLGSSLEADGNVIGEPEHGEAAKVADLAKAAGIKVTGDTEHYLNFDKNIREYSEWRLEYNVKFANTADRTWFNDKIGLNVEDEIKNSNKLDTVDADGYTRIIPRESKITPEDVAIMKGIFTYADNEDSNSLGISGYVFAGTNSQEEVKRNLDLSDTMTWKNFYNDYILGDDSEIKSSDNGEWLRVIDNNGDGVAEYVLRTDFIMTTVLDYEKRTDLYNVEYDVDGNGTTGNNIVSKIPAGEIRKDDNVDMSVGAVILYTYIDGYYYISNPEVQVLTVDKKSIDQKKNTFTADGETYTWSGIDEEAAKYYDDVSELNYDIAYNMYFDHFGFIRLATEARRNFVLLTDAYFKTDLRDHEWKVELYNGEEKIESADVVDAARDNDDRTSRGIGYDKKVDGFIDTVENDHQGNRGTWQRLNTFGEFYQQVDDNDYVHYIDKNRTAAAKDAKDPFYTNIALASETDGTWTLQDVTDIDTVYNSLRRNYNVYELAGTNKQYNNSITQIKQDTLKAKNTDLWGITGNNLTVAGAQETSGWTGAAITNLQAIQTNNLTQYYLVENAGNSAKRTVTSWVGYKNLPADLDNFVPLYAYAVTHGTNSNYEIADVVVFEGTYEEATKIPQLVTTGINPKWINALGVDGDGKYTEHTEDWALFTESQLQAVDAYTDGLYAPQLRFYADKKTPITPSMYKDYGIYAGTVVVAEETKDAGEYIELSAWGDLVHDRVYFNTNDVEAYEIDQITRYNGEAAHNLKVNVNENILKGDKLIVVMEGKTVKMVVNVSASGKDGEPWANRRTGVETPANRIVKLAELYTEIETVMTTPDADPVVTVKYVNVPADITTEPTEIKVEHPVAGTKNYTFTLPSAPAPYSWNVDFAEGDESKCDGKSNSGLVYTLYHVTGDITIEVSYTGATKNLTIANGGMTDVEVWVGGEKVATPYTSNPVAVGTEVRVAFKTSDAQKPGTATETNSIFTVEPKMNTSTGKWEFTFIMPTHVSHDVVLTLGQTTTKAIPVTYVGDDSSITLNKSTTSGAAANPTSLSGLKLLVNGAEITTGKKFTGVTVTGYKANGDAVALTATKHYTLATDGEFTGTSTAPAGWADVVRVEIDASVVADEYILTVNIAENAGTPISVATVQNATAVAGQSNKWKVVNGDTVEVSFTNSDDLVVTSSAGSYANGRVTFTVSGADVTITVGAVQEYTVTVKSIPNVEITVTIDGKAQANTVNGADVNYTIKGSAEVKLDAVAANGYILIGAETMTETVSSNKTITMDVKAELAAPPAQNASDFTGGATSDAGKNLKDKQPLHTGDAVGGASPVEIEAVRNDDGSITITPTIVGDGTPITLTAGSDPNDPVRAALIDYWYQPADKADKNWAQVVGAMTSEEIYPADSKGFLVYLDYADYTDIIFVNQAKVTANKHLGQKTIDGVTYTIDWTKVVAALEP